MKNLFVLAAIGSLAFASATAHAGTPGGLQILVVRSAESARFDKLVDEYFSRHHPDDGAGCLDALLNIDSVTTSTPLKNVGATDVFKAAASKQEHKALARKLDRFRDADHPHGYDAAFAYRSEGEQLVFYAVGAFAPEPVRISKLALSSMQNRPSVDKAICEALVRIPVNAEP
jgi:hypothetical protein